MTTALSSDLRMPATTPSPLASVRARTTTSYPALANTSAMPVAIVPVPTTPTVEIGRWSLPSSPGGGGVSESATTSGEPGAA